MHGGWHRRKRKKTAPAKYKEEIYYGEKISSKTIHDVDRFGLDDGNDGIHHLCPMVDVIEFIIVQLELIEHGGLLYE